jgi:hypothetical protein
VLLGQLLGGLGQVKAWAASLGAEPPRAASTLLVTTRRVGIAHRLAWEMVGNAHPTVDLARCDR